MRPKILSCPTVQKLRKPQHQPKHHPKHQPFTLNHSPRKSIHLIQYHVFTLQDQITRRKKTMEKRPPLRLFRQTNQIRRWLP